MACNVHAYFSGSPNCGVNYSQSDVDILGELENYMVDFNSLLNVCPTVLKLNCFFFTLPFLLPLFPAVLEF